MSSQQPPTQEEWDDARFGGTGQYGTPPPTICAYGHTEAEHERVGACRRPSLPARVAGHAAYPGGSNELRIAYERGWDDATAAKEQT